METQETHNHGPEIQEQGTSAGTQEIQFDRHRSVSCNSSQCLPSHTIMAVSRTQENQVKTPPRPYFTRQPSHRPRDHWTHNINNTSHPGATLRTEVTHFVPEISGQYVGRQPCHAVCEKVIQDGLFSGSIVPNPQQLMREEKTTPIRGDETTLLPKNTVKRRKTSRFGGEYT